MRVSQRTLREAILADRDDSVEEKKQRLPVRDGRKTTLMRNVEARFGRVLEELLYEGSLNKVAMNLEIDRVTVIRWRKKLNA